MKSHGISRNGRAVTVHRAESGNGQDEHRLFPTDAEAIAWIEGVFLSAIAEDPDDRERYFAYADWLVFEGMPLGALIRAQAARDEDPEDQDLVRPALARLLECAGERMGDSASFIPKLGSEPQFHLNLKWRWGFINTARISSPDEIEGPFLDAVLGCPAFRFIRDLDLEMRTLTSLPVASFPASVKELRIDAEVLATGPLLRALSERLPGLESLVLQADALEGPFDLPKLIELNLWTEEGAFSENVFAALRDAPCRTRLQKLGLFTSHRNSLPAADTLDREVFLPSGRYPSLIQLELGELLDGDEVCRRLASSVIAPQLDLMVLTGRIGEEGVRALIRAKKRFAALRRIEFVIPPLPARVEDELLAAYPNTYLSEEAVREIA